MRSAKLNKHIRKTSTFKLEGFDQKGGFCRTRAYFFRFKGDPDVTLCVKVRDLVDTKQVDPEFEAVIATIRHKPKAKK